MYKFNEDKVKDDLAQWIRDYFNKNGMNSKAVIGISGGKDSTIVTGLCVEALGADRVFGVLMPQGCQWDLHVAELVCKYFGIKNITINIYDAVNEIYRQVSNKLLSTDDDNFLNSVVTNNTPARIRMTTLYAISAQINGRVANTCNLSENYLGWNTKYGDDAGDFSPLASLTNNEVVRIGMALGIDYDLIFKKPEDGLTGRTDEENFRFTYSELDKYLRGGEINPDVVAKIQIMHNDGIHKMTKMPYFPYNPYKHCGD